MKVNIIKPIKPVVQLPHFIIIEAAHSDWLKSSKVNYIIELLTGCNPETAESWRFVIINTDNQKVDYHDRYAECTGPITFLIEQDFFEMYYGGWKQAFDQRNLSIGNVFG